MKLAKSVKIVELALRDGLQNETSKLSIEQRLTLADKLLSAGIKNLEVGAYVSEKWVPQMAVTKNLVPLVNVLIQKKKIQKITTTTLVPNEQGMQEAVRSKVKEVAIFGACTESFSKKNINCSIEESFERFSAVMKIAKKHKIKVRGYLSVCFGCPFEGRVDEKKVLQIAERMYKLGVYEISIGDTIGVASAGQVISLFKKLVKVIPVKKLAGHFHDTRGQALSNILAAYLLGVQTFDSSLGGLGGCPYAPGASGNVATEDVVYMFNSLQVKTGIDLSKLIETNRWLQPHMDHPLPSKVGRVGLLQPIGSIS